MYMNSVVQFCNIHLLTHTLTYSIDYSIDYSIVYFIVYSIEFYNLVTQGQTDKYSERFQAVKAFDY